MSTINTNHLRVQNAKNFVSCVNGTDTNSYLFVGRVTPWDNDESPPVPENNNKEIYRTHNEMIALSRIVQSDVLHMIPMIRWTAGVVYDMYRHDYSQSNVSYNNANNLYDSLFYVINQNNDVYVCLFNDKNTPSKVEPQNSSNSPFYTSDGYQWLRLYSIDDYHIQNRTTQNYMPILIEDSNAKTQEGAVYTVAINSPGGSYTRNPEGAPNQLPFYYCKIVGDGEGAIARVRINNAQVAQIDVVRSGSGYTFAELDFVTNRIYASIKDLDNNQNGLDALGDGTLLTTVIISPPGGWGTDLVRELGGVRVAVFSDLKFDYDELLPGTEFRQIGLLSNPETDQVNPNTMLACSGAKVFVVDDGLSYIVGETITQTIREIDSEGNLIANHKAIGSVVGWDEVGGMIRYVQIPELHQDVDGVMYSFSGIEPIAGESSTKSTTPNTTFNGLYKGSVYSEGYSVSEFIDYTGEILYLTNVSPIVRASTQTERVSLVVTY